MSTLPPDGTFMLGLPTCQKGDGTLSSIPGMSVSLTLARSGLGMGSNRRFSKSRKAFTAPGMESSLANTHAFSSLMPSISGSHPGTCSANQSNSVTTQSHDAGGACVLSGCMPSLLYVMTAKEPTLSLIRISASGMLVALSHSDLREHKWDHSF